MKLKVEKELLERAASYCSDETTKEEIELLLLRGWMEENDWRDIRAGIDKTTTLPIVGQYY